jgi:plasmid stabilization system protein ParE
VRVRFTPAARAQFLAAVAYIAGERPAAARRFLKKATTALRRLTRHPESGRRLPEFSDLPHREVVLPPYRFFYRLDGQTVWIVAVWPGAQLPDAPEGK